VNPYSVAQTWNRSARQTELEAKTADELPADGDTAAQIAPVGAAACREALNKARRG
jgi:hypothetical protein